MSKQMARAVGGTVLRRTNGQDDALEAAIKAGAKIDARPAGGMALWKCAMRCFVERKEEGFKQLVDVEADAREEEEIKELGLSADARLLLRRVLPWVVTMTFVSGVVIGRLFCGEADEQAKDEATEQASEESLADGCMVRADNVTLDPRFVSAYFNLSCLEVNGTGDPCDVHVATEYADLLIGGLRVEYLVLTVASTMGLFSLAQIGGIPRPSLEPGERSAWGTLKASPAGTLFWLAWMTTQFLQWLTVLGTLIMHVASFVSVRHRLWPCLVLDAAGTPLLDDFASKTCERVSPFLACGRHCRFLHRQPSPLTVDCLLWSAGLRASRFLLAASCCSSCTRTSSRWGCRCGLVAASARRTLWLMREPTSCRSLYPS